MNIFRSYILFLFDLQELVVRLTDERDLFFLYTLRIGEEDFQRYVEIGIPPFGVSYEYLSLKDVFI